MAPFCGVYPDVPITIGDRRFTISVTVGIALCDPAHDRREEVLRDADTALYRAKAAKGGHGGGAGP